MVSLCVHANILVIMYSIYRKWDQFNKVCQISTQTITKLIAGSGSYMGVSKMITVAQIKRTRLKTLLLLLINFVSNTIRNYLKRIKTLTILKIHCFHKFIVICIIHTTLFFLYIYVYILNLYKIFYLLFKQYIQYIYIYI